MFIYMSNDTKYIITVLLQHISKYGHLWSTQVQYLCVCKVIKHSHRHAKICVWAWGWAMTDQTLLCVEYVNHSHDASELILITHFNNLHIKIHVKFINNASNGITLCPVLKESTALKNCVFESCKADVETTIQQTAVYLSEWVTYAYGIRKRPKTIADVILPVHYCLILTRNSLQQLYKFASDQFSCQLVKERVLKP